MNNREIWQRRGLVAATLVVPLALGTGCSDDDVTATRPSVASVSLSPAAATMLTGDRLRIHATLLDSDGDTLLSRPIDWSSSDEGVAAVDETGYVTAIAEGGATVTATSEGVAGRTSLSVESKPQPVGFLGYVDANAKLTACSTCHAEEQTEWRRTTHSVAWSTLQSDDQAEARCEPCHAVTELGNTVAQPAGHELASDERFYDVQCESCHGPGRDHAVAADPGAEPPHASIAEGRGLNSGCAECHRFPEQPYLEEWEQSVMSRIPSYDVAAATDPSCLGCHEGKAALVSRFGETADYQEKDDGEPLPIVCVVCHDPHSSDIASGLRATVTEPTADFLCLRCHALDEQPSGPRGPHAAQGRLLLSAAGWSPPGFEEEVDNQRFITTHGPATNQDLCIRCHMPIFDVPGSYRTTGHIFDAIPCIDGRGVPYSGDCPDEERSFDTCASAGCHGGPKFAMAVDYWGRIEQLNALLDTLWIDSDGDRVIDPSDFGLLPDVVELGDTILFDLTDDSVTLAEGALWNAQLAHTADRTHFADGEVFGTRFWSGKSSGNGVHNPFLLEALLRASIKSLHQLLGN